MPSYRSTAVATVRRSAATNSTSIKSCSHAAGGLLLNLWLTFAWQRIGAEALRNAPDPSRPPRSNRAGSPGGRPDSAICPSRGQTPELGRRGADTHCPMLDAQSPGAASRLRLTRIAGLFPCPGAGVPPHLGDTYRSPRGIRGGPRRRTAARAVGGRLRLPCGTPGADSRLPGQRVRAFREGAGASSRAMRTVASRPERPQA
jgi:hypothetical protein